MKSIQYLNAVVDVVIDRPLGSRHPKFDYIYPINYGFVPNTLAGDGEEIDVYILGVDKPIFNFKGKCIAIVNRLNDNEDKLVVCPFDFNFSVEEIKKSIEFQEKWFKYKLIY